MALPRIVSIGPDGFLRQQPAPEFEKLWGAGVTAAAMPLTATPAVVRGIRGDCLELNIEVSLGKAGASITLNGDGLLGFGRAATLLGRNERYRLRIFLDKRVFEVYANDGQAALYGVTDAGRDDLGIAVSGQGSGAELTAIQAWPLKPAKFDLSRFRV